MDIQKEKSSSKEINEIKKGLQKSAPIFFSISFRFSISVWLIRTRRETLSHILNIQYAADCVKINIYFISDLNIDNGFALRPGW